MTWTQAFIELRARLRFWAVPLAVVFMGGTLLIGL